jgi:Na+-translocating ferredoxin:NAD+ oxidoreductase RnfC subunit
MMGRLARELDEPVTKTTGGIVVLPAGHALLDRYGAGWQRVAKIGRSACDQCSFCTQLCPRYLLGHPIEPHRAMQSLGFTAGHDEMIAGTLYCCECNLCSLYSCPESLSPKDVCSHAKPLARERGLVFKGRPEDVRPHPLAQDRRVPIKRLIARLGISQFNFPAPLTDVSLAPARVNVPLKQHAGVPAVALVKPGDTVHEGDLIAAPPKGKMGASIHASIDGIVSSVNGAVVIEA